MGTLAIQKKKYFQAKKTAEADHSLVAKIVKSLDDIKHGRITEWKP